MGSRAYLLTSMLAVVIYGGCAPHATKTEQTFKPTFDYSPPNQVAPGSADVTFAVVNASYSEAQPWMTESPFSDFSKNMSLDFQEILSARGFNVRGPFRAYDEMTFPEKKGSDLVLQPILEVRVDLQPRAKTNIGLLGDSYSYQGNASVSGRVTLSLMESLSKERMWFKSIELPRSTFEWEGEWGYRQLPAYPDVKDPGLAVPLGKTLEPYYKQVMEAAWKYLDPEEMRIVKKQSEEIRKKKVY